MDDNVRKTRMPDYLKYWRVIRRYYQQKYNLPIEDLEMLLFLHSEKYFKRQTFVDYNRVIGWDPKRLSRFMADGWIREVRPRRGRNAAIYGMSPKGHGMLTSLYRVLEGQEIPATMYENPMFKRKVSYTNKEYQIMIMNINEERKSIKMDAAPHLRKFKYSVSKRKKKTDTPEVKVKVVRGPYKKKVKPLPPHPSPEL